MNKNWQTWSDWALSETAAADLKIAYENGKLSDYEVFDSLESTDQNPKWHPEGNVWLHTLYVIDAAIEIALREKLTESQRIILMLSAMCHDLGKPDTTKLEDGETQVARACSGGRTNNR